MFHVPYQGMARGDLWPIKQCCYSPPDGGQTLPGFRELSMHTGSRRSSLFERLETALSSLWLISPCERISFFSIVLGHFALVRGKRVYETAGTRQLFNTKPHQRVAESSRQYINKMEPLEKKCCIT